MTVLDPAHASRIASAIDAVNRAAAVGMSPIPDALAILDAVAALQADLRGVLEAERRRSLMAIA